LQIAPYFLFLVCRQSEPDLSLGPLPLLSDKERRKSDFLSHYQELTCRAALAIKTVDRIVGGEPLTPPPPPATASTTQPPLLPSPLSPGAESVEFNEEEVLKTCQVAARLAVDRSSFSPEL
jgi:hypothetical protein